jgi:uncharacterized protein
MEQSLAIDEYLDGVRRWQEKRHAELSDPDGWLSLAGLYWLQPGSNSFGADPGNDLQFPVGKADVHLGWFWLEDGQVRIEVAPGVDVRHAGQPISQMRLEDDRNRKPTILTHGSLSWFLIRRGERIGLRLRDRDSSYLQHFTGVEQFEIDPAWCVEAVFEPYEPPKRLLVPTILGTVDHKESPGALSFEIDGIRYRLDVTGMANQGFSIVFADATTGKETYGGGRFLQVDPIDQNGQTRIDFNRAYNPPCAFTPYATCPRPTEENKLPLRITAGEKSYHTSTP